MLWTTVAIDQQACYTTRQPVLSRQKRPCVVVIEKQSLERYIMVYYSIMHLSSASPRGGGPRADVGTLLIVHFKVLVFPHPWGLFLLQSPHYLAKPSTQLDLKMHFRTLFWFFEQLANTRTLHSDAN